MKRQIGIHGTNTLPSSTFDGEIIDGVEFSSKDIIQEEIRIQNRLKEIYHYNGETPDKLNRVVTNTMALKGYITLPKLPYIPWWEGLIEKTK